MSTKRYQITALIYDKRGRVLSVGQNSYVKTHPLQQRHAELCGEPHKIFLHAEISAITRCLDLTKAHKIRVLRFREDGTPGTAKPCTVCESAIRAAGIKVIEHT